MIDTILLVIFAVLAAAIVELVIMWVIFGRRPKR